MIPTRLGYHHHGQYLSFLWIYYCRNPTGIEYWQYTHPPSEETTAKCNAEGEDPTCSASIPSRGVNPAHMTVRQLFFSQVILTVQRSISTVFWNISNDAILLLRTTRWIELMNEIDFILPFLSLHDFPWFDLGVLTMNAMPTYMECRMGWPMVWSAIQMLSFWEL